MPWLVGVIHEGRLCFGGTLPTGARRIKLGRQVSCADIGNERKQIRTFAADVRTLAALSLLPISFVKTGGQI